MNQERSQGFSVQVRRFGIPVGKVTDVAPGSSGKSFETRRVLWNGFQDYNFLGIDWTTYTEKTTFSLNGGKVEVKRGGESDGNSLEQLITTFTPTAEGTKVKLGFGKTVFVSTHRK